MDGFDFLPDDVSGESADNGFDFWELGHGVVKS